MSDTVTVYPRTTDWYVEKLVRKEPFALSRWGDSEWISVLSEEEQDWQELCKITPAWGKGSRNKEGHEYPPQMGEHLREVLRSVPYYEPADRYVLATAPRFFNPDAPHPWPQLGRVICRWLERNKPCRMLNWHDADAFTTAMIRRRFEPFLAAIRRYDVVMIGPFHLQKLQESGLFNCRYFAVCPDKNAYDAASAMVNSVFRHLQGVCDDVLVMVSTGPSAALIVDELFQLLEGGCTVMDVGSIWDPFAGRLSRSYMQEPGLRAYVRKLQSEAHRGVL